MNDLVDPFGSLDLKRASAALIAAHAAAPDTPALSLRLALAAHTGHTPARKALEAASLEVKTTPKDAEVWFNLVLPFGRVAGLRAAFAAAVQALPAWEAVHAADARPRAALIAVAAWFGQLRASPRRRTLPGLDAWLVTPEGPLELACVEAARDCDEALKEAQASQRPGNEPDFAAVQALTAITLTVWYAAGGPRAVLLRRGDRSRRGPVLPGSRGGHLQCPGQGRSEGARSGLQRERPAARAGRPAYVVTSSLSPGHVSPNPARKPRPETFASVVNARKASFSHAPRRG